MSKLSTLTFAFLLLSAVTTETLAQRTATKRSSTRVKPVENTTVVDWPINTIPLKELALNNKKDIINNISVDKDNPKSPAPECAQTKAINNTEKCDAYPWISSDGLRLYFNSNRDGGHGNIYFSERASIDLPFEAPHKQFPALDNKYYAVSLTADELTMIITLQGYTLYIATRKSIKENFSTPKIIEELKERKLYGPGISPDGSEIMAIDCTGDVGKFDGTVRYVKNSAGLFIKKERLAVPENTIVGPGQFGKDGISYFCSLKSKTDDTETLFCFKRASKDAAFTLAYELPAAVNVTRASLQPCLNGDGTILAYCSNSSGMWDDDDIRVVQLDKLSQEDEKATELKPLVVEKQSPLQNQVIKQVVQQQVLSSSPVTASLSIQSIAPFTLSDKNNNDQKVAVSVYPNPFNSYLVITFVKQPASQNLCIELFDGNGRLAFTKKISGNNIQVKTGDLPAGMYTYRISNTTGTIANGQLIATK